MDTGIRFATSHFANASKARRSRSDSASESMPPSVLRTLRSACQGRTLTGKLGRGFCKMPELSDFPAREVFRRLRYTAEVRPRRICGFLSTCKIFFEFLNMCVQLTQ